MQATAELQVIPIGNGVSVRREITRVVELLKGHAFRIEPHASGTNIECRCRRERGANSPTGRGTAWEYRDGVGVAIKAEAGGYAG